MRSYFTINVNMANNYGPINNIVLSLTCHKTSNYKHIPVLNYVVEQYVIYLMVFRVLNV